MSFDLVSPLVTQLGFGGILGFIVGFAIRKILKFLAVIVGLIFVFTQYLAWKGFIDVHYERIYEVAQGLFGELGGSITAFSLPAFMTANVPLIGSFVAGLGVGFKIRH